MRADVFTKVATVFVVLAVLSGVALPRLERLAQESALPPANELQRGVMFEASARNG